MYFYQEKQPELGDNVIADVKSISDVAVYCTLPAYGNLEVMMPVSEINVRRHKKVSDYVRVGQSVPVHVIRSDGHKVDVSMKQIHEREVNACTERHHRDARINLIVRTAANLDPAATEALYRDAIWSLPPDVDVYGLFEDVRACEEGEALPAAFPPALVAAIRSKLPAASYTAEQEIMLRFGPYHDGAERLTAELRRLAALDGLAVFVVAPPKYRLVATDKTRARADARLVAALASIPAPV
jgi:translation initiation factor 2 alpha subunit (eIF-2alpha)